MAESKWTYSGDPATSDMDELRFLVQDTDPEVKLLGDAELDYLLAKWMPAYGSVTYVASVAANVISRKFAGVVTISADGVSVNVADISQRYAKLAIQLRAEYTAGSIGGEVDLSSLMWDSELDAGIKPLMFGMGVHDNPEAGQQDYGGELPAPRIDWGR